MARTPPAPARLRIVIVEVASGLTRPLEAGSQLPSLIYQRGSNWHPKQDVLTYQTGDEARVYDVTSNQSRSLGTGSNPLFWSEDLLAYRASASATSGLAVLDFGTNTTVGRSPWLSDTQFRYTGGQLTLAGVSTGSCDGVTMLHPGGATRCLPGANQPKWSPDGSRLAITQSDGSNLRAVAVVDGASGQSRILIRGLAIPDQRCWDYRIHWSTNNAFLRLTPNVVYCGGI
jgi:hypothetical protein